MNGATTDPCDNTIKPPNKTKISNIGNNQYFFLILKKLQNSFKKLILKLIFQIIIFIRFIYPISFRIIFF